MRWKPASGWPPRSPDMQERLYVDQPMSAVADLKALVVQEGTDELGPRVDAVIRDEISGTWAALTQWLHSPQEGFAVTAKSHDIAWDVVAWLGVTDRVTWAQPEDDIELG